MFIDFDCQALLDQVDTITPHVNRRLKSEDPVTTEKYLELFKFFVAEHNVRERLGALSLVAHTMPPISRQESYDAIDRDVTRVMLSAEIAAKRPTGKYVWSPKLREHCFSLGTGDFVFVNLSAGDNFATRGNRCKPASTAITS